MDEVRTLLEKLMKERREDYFSISRLLGRNAAYFQQFMKRGTPRKLREDDRRVLARYFGVSEEALGGPPPSVSPDTTSVPRFILGASAGPGAMPGNERPEDHITFENKWLRKMSANPGALQIIQVEGDSMVPVLGDGDDILVDTRDGADRLRDGIYVIRMDDALLVKRIAVGPKRKLAVMSDNASYPSWPDIAPGAIEVVGRVIWAGRKIG